MPNCVRVAPRTTLAAASALIAATVAALPGTAGAADAASTIASPVCRSFARTGTAGDAALSALPDGGVWYADRNGTRLVRIAPDRSRTPIVPGDATTGRLSGIAIGPDGQVWYTKDTANRIGHVPPEGGEGAEFETPEQYSFPTELIADRGGRLWFLASVKHYVGEVGANGAVVVHRGPSMQGRDFTPVGVAVGADGNLWMTDTGHNAVYRFDVRSHAFKRFDIATPQAQPQAIAAGADGNVWFTMFPVRKVGRITPQGAITEYSLGDLGGGAPRGIVGTADGTMWVTTSGRTAVRILADGTVQPFPCASGLGRAILGPKGAPWFLDNDRVWVVEDANAPQAPKQVAGSPWPVKGEPKPVAEPQPAPAAAPIIPTLKLREAIERLQKTKGRVVLQLTSTDPKCPYCVRANPVLEGIAQRRAKDATYWRVDYRPWTSVSQDADAVAAGVQGLPTIIVFVDGQETHRVSGHYVEAEVEPQVFATK
jgi:virginiamycin B lyase